jgi:hypothetical protein
MADRPGTKDAEWKESHPRFPSLSASGRVQGLPRHIWPGFTSSPVAAAGGSPHARPLRDKAPGCAELTLTSLLPRPLLPAAAPQDHASLVRNWGLPRPASTGWASAKCRGQRH